MEPNPPFNWSFLFLALQFRESSLKLRQLYFSTDTDKKLMLRCICCYSFHVHGETYIYFSSQGVVMFIL